MFRSAIATTGTTLAAALTFLAACGPAPRPEVDGDFAALQARGEAGMGVDQYASTHIFDALADGGRIEYQHNTDDAAGVATIRSHLQEIRGAFEAGDFSTPAFVHAREVPGTDVMAQRREHIEYRYQDLPRGGEVRLVTTDPEALEAIREFMAFQRADHRAEGMDHGAMDHGAMDHGGMDHGRMDHGGMDHGPSDPGGTGQQTRDPGGMSPGAMSPGGMGRGGMGRGGMGGGTMGQGMGPGAMDHMGMGGNDPNFAADMEIVHELVTNHRAITRTVVHLPNGIRTLTESSSPPIAGQIVAHVANMERRLEAGEVFNLFSHTLPVIFESYHRIHSEFEYLPTGVAVVQTSDDAAIVEALQAHAAEVTELVDEGMIAMMRGMMENRMQGMMRGGMEGGGPPGRRPAP